MKQTENQRLKILLTALNLTQKDVITAAKVAQPTMSRAVKGLYPIPKKVRHYLYTKHGVNLEWLDYGVGQMMIDTNTVNEPSEQYLKGYGRKIKIPEINKRFIEQWEILLSRHSGYSQKELCTRYNIYETDIPKIKSGSINPNNRILTSLVMHTSWNANYTLSGNGSPFIIGDFAKIQKELIQIKEENILLKKNAELMARTIELLEEKLNIKSAKKSAK